MWLEMKGRSAIRDTRQNYHKTEYILIELKVILSLTCVNILVILLSIV
jgi:hypothetical protein